jgi:hypothetical protein
VKIGLIVFYENKEYIILRAYENGFYEIREKANNFKVELVHSSNLTEIKENFI